MNGSYNRMFGGEATDGGERAERVRENGKGIIIVKGNEMEGYEDRGEFCGVRTGPLG